MHSRFLLRLCFYYNCAVNLCPWSDPAGFRLKSLPAAVLDPAMLCWTLLCWLLCWAVLHIAVLSAAVLTAVVP